MRSTNVMARPWIYRALLAAVAALVALSAFLQLRRAASADDPRATSELGMLAKMALAAGSVPGAEDAYEKPFLEKLDAAAADPSPRERARALRRKAIWCSYRERGCAGPALDALDAISPEDRRPAPPDEAAVLREILTSESLSPERARALSSRLPEIRMGFFDHLLRERLFRREGDAARADESLAAARRAAFTAMAAIVGFTALLGAGVLAWMILLLHPARSRIAARLSEGLASRGEVREGEGARRLAIVVAFLAASIALPHLAGPLGLDALNSPLERAIVTAGLEIVLLVLVFAAHAVFLKPAGADLGFRKTSPLRALGVGALAYLLLWPVLLAVMLPLARLFERLGLPTRSHPIVGQLQAASDAPLAMALWFVIAAALAPVLEEAVFRGALQGGLRARLGGRWALLLTAAPFALIHPQVGLGLVGVLLVGLALSIVRAHEESLWPGVVLHAINNGVALLLATALLGG